MRFKSLILCLLITSQIGASDSIHFMRKIIATAAGICVTYGFEQDKAEDIVKVLHAIFNTKLKLNFHTKHTDSDKYNAHVKYPAYGVRAIAGLLAMSFLNTLLDHEDY